MLGLRLPGSGKYVEFQAEPPADLRDALEAVSLL
jgi:hypothetical protein